MQNVHTVINKNKYLSVSELGTKHNLSFSSYLEFGNKIIALDGLNRSLMVLEKIEDAERSYIIELNKMEAVTLKKSYGSIGPEQLNKKSMEEFLKTIALQFINKDEIIVLTFYDSTTDDPANLPKLERNARNWQMILSKMIIKQELKTAS